MNWFRESNNLEIEIPISSGFAQSFQSLNGGFDK